MKKEQGSLSIHSENIFPIIKKWLYSDHDIFIRELISNGCDAITKLKKLEIMGEYTIPDEERFRIEVIVNPEKKTIQFIDNGIGMTAEEVKEYINQIAFSGAEDFLNKYKDKTNEEQIIGHFGLGFYSAFMVADKVTIETLSYRDNAESVHWESDGGTEYSMKKGKKKSHGTEITLYLSEESYEFSNEYRVKEVITKYCSFMPVEIYFQNATAVKEESPKEEEKKEAEVIDATVAEDGTVSEETKEAKKEKDEPKPLNQTHPLWTKHPNDCTEEEYKTFYREVFHDYKEPLFWIHLNMDYPFHLKGILYFPKLNTEYDTLEGTIKLYNNQVFIADNIKEVIPEFLMLLKGVIDCPDLPLNVSRSALQNDGFVKKISEYISKKVADKLSGMYKVDLENYEKFWEDISPFIKFGCLKDDKFREKMKEYIIFKNLKGNYITLPEYIKGTKKEEAQNEAEKTEDTTKETATEDQKEQETEKKKTIIYYVTDVQQQSQYIRLFEEQNMDAIILTHHIDQPFITQLESQDDAIRFQRIDAELSDDLKEETNQQEEEEQKKETEELKGLFQKILQKEKLEVKVEKFKTEQIAAMITLSEESRRMQDMMKMYRMEGMDPNMFGQGETLVLNHNHPLVQYVRQNKEGDMVEKICKQLYDLAMLTHKPLSADEMTAFVQRSNELLLEIIKER